MSDGLPTHKRGRAWSFLVEDGIRIGTRRAAVADELSHELARDVVRAEVRVGQLLVGHRRRVIPADNPRRDLRALVCSAVGRYNRVSHELLADRALQVVRRAAARADDLLQRDDLGVARGSTVFEPLERARGRHGLRVRRVDRGGLCIRRGVGREPLRHPHARAERQSLSRARPRARGRRP